ncbi:DUF262 domain-containing protein [Tenacibaculum finnmarkense]|uniref:DUF262 domain-containing protein n=1 Tax=Tenacibaculum finnmarkense TaxID=2781243 RepID=UPI000C408C1B|nr:DUF262 domain-containing protein [Tenacibaculum finnmarkense]MCD8438672.1 DUF262 domain-containing protein [Tenacibaculum finnmarkense genomovar ulcerans]MCG8719604.1 DUF262 domain-containing protein [Tenacibaculum finnmarkense]SOS53541.1 conserved hypothetical protein [Tenacibaculum finnmarkense]
MDKKIKEGIPSDGVKIIELYNKIDNELLMPQPIFQRKLVWKKQHKYAFIDTILNNYPFPEVYIASSDIDVEKMIVTEVIVDGQQRLTTIVDYIKGNGDFETQNKITSFEKLTPTEKKEFLNYKVSVKDLKDIGKEIIKEIFQRINSTEYSLNTVEKNNAIYGGGEIAIFCKQLVDSTYTANEDDTDIILSISDKKYINSFFDDNNIFTENDKKRMYNFQYLMLYIATLLEGSYFDRSRKVDEYLDKFNSYFPDSSIVIRELLGSIDTLKNLNFSDRSYWYNKANLFTLLIELSKIDLKQLNLENLEIELLSLENKLDVYFTANKKEDLNDISEDEKKYFEFSRQGSNGKASREHRGKVIKNILDKCIETNDEPKDFEKNNLNSLDENNIPFSIITPTATGLNKSIMDAVSKVREFLKKEEIHNYDSQKLGPTYKEKKNCFFKNIENNDIESELSLYRSNGRGDYRFWFKDLNLFSEAGNKLAIIYIENSIILLNISKINYTTYLDGLRK